MKQRSHQDFHVGLKAFVEQNKKLLILQDQDGLWELPGGRIEMGERENPLPKILLREIAEELGKDCEIEVGPVFHAWVRKPSRDVNDIYTNKDFCIFLVGFACVLKSGEIVLSKEHKNFRWISKEEVGGIDFENTYKEAVQYYFESSL